MSKVIRINGLNYENTAVDHLGCGGCAFNSPRHNVTEGCAYCTSGSILTLAHNQDEQTDDGGLLPPQGALE